MSITFGEQVGTEKLLSIQRLSKGRVYENTGDGAIAIRSAGGIFVLYRKGGTEFVENGYIHLQPCTALWREVKIHITINKI